MTASSRREKVELLRSASIEKACPNTVICVIQLLYRIAARPLNQASGSRLCHNSQKMQSFLYACRGPLQSLSYRSLLTSGPLDETRVPLTPDRRGPRHGTQTGTRQNACTTPRRPLRSSSATPLAGGRIQIQPHFTSIEDYQRGGGSTGGQVLMSVVFA